MNIVIIGASGGVGRWLLQFALAAGHKVTAAVRGPAALDITHWNLTTVACDVRDPLAVQHAVAGQEVVFSTLGDLTRGPTNLYSTGTENILDAMRMHGVRRLVSLSNFGVLNERASDLGGALLLMMVRRVIRHTLTDHRLALDAMREHGGEWVAVRPVAMNRGPHTGKYRVALEGLPHRGTKISRADVADFMLKQATSSEYLCSVPAIAY